MGLGEYLQDRLKVFVWSGFYGREQILEHLREDAEGEGEPHSSQELAGIIDGELRVKREAEKAWPELTDCDKLDQAFARLRAGGLIALQNAGVTQSDGFQDCCQEYQEMGAGKDGVRGFCFYTFQDLERAVLGYGLDFGFGATEGESEPTLAVGRSILEAMEEQGFEVDWKGTPDRRPRLVKIDWKRRGPWPE